jgi:hypothetical protein
MSRDDGFAIADTDTGMLADPKVVALARRLRDPIRTGAAIALYDAVRLASWKAGRRLTLDESLPGWWLDPVDELAAALVAVKLLDDELRLPEHAWEGWFGPARARRDERREAGRRGGLAKARNASDSPRSSGATAELQRSSTRPSVPSVPTVRPSAPGGSKEPGETTNGMRGGDPRPLRELVGDLPFLRERLPADPPSESPDAPESADRPRTEEASA